MATTWYYYANGQKHGAVSGGQLKWLAKSGKITPETLVENEEGKSVLAGKVKGLTFVEAVPSDEPATFSFPCPNCKNTLQAKTRSAGKTKECPTCGESFMVPTAVVPPSPIETESYGLASPPPEPSPFTTSMPETVSAPVAAPIETENPFTASMPVVAKPTVLPSTASPSAATKPADNPFTATMPMPTSPFTTSELVESPNSWMAFTSLVLGTLGLGLAGYNTYRTFVWIHYVRFVSDIPDLSDSFPIVPIDFSIFIPSLCWIAIILGVIMGHRGLKTNNQKFAKPGLFLCGIAFLVSPGIFLYYSAYESLSLIVLILGVFWGHRGLKTSKKKIAKIGLLACWIVCWIMCLQYMLWLSFDLMPATPGGGSSGGGSRVASDAGGGGNRIETALDRSMAILQQSSDIQTEFVFNMRSPETMRNAARRFNNLDISSLPAGFQFTHRRLGSAMTALADASIEVERTSNLPRTEHIRALDRRQRAHDNFMAALNEYSLAFERRDWMR